MSKEMRRNKNKIGLKSCPKCGGGVTLWVNMDVGAFASCHVCKAHYAVCGMKEIPVYDGYKIRKCTKDKVKRLWNRMAEELSSCPRMTTVVR